MKRGRGKREEG
jgi:hypothetical protein